MRSEVWRWFVRGVGLAFGIALAVGVVYALLVSARVAVLVFVALLLAAGLEPLIDRVRARTPLGRGATLLLVYAVFFALVAGLLLLVVPSAISQFNDLGPKLTPLLEEARAWARTIEPRGLSAGLIGLLDTVQDVLVPSGTDVPEPDTLIALGLTFAEAVISVISVLALVYFWLTERARMQALRSISCPQIVAPERARGGTKSSCAWVPGFVDSCSSWARSALPRASPIS